LQTTYENFRYRSEQRVNPYDRGAAENFGEIFCTKIPPSKNNFRAEVEQDVQGHSVSVLPNTDNQEDAGNLRVKIGSDVEEGGPSSIGAEHILGEESHEEVQSRYSNGHEVGPDVKEGYEDALTRAIGRPISPLDSSDSRSGVYPRRSSWGRKGENWEISPEILSSSLVTESGRFNGQSTTPGSG